MKQIIFLITAILFANTSFAQSNSKACQKIQDGTYYELGESETESYYIFEGEWMYEYTNHGKDFIKSKINWENDCTYTLTYTSSTISNLGIEPGTMLRVQITAVEGNQYHYQYLPKDVLGDGVIVKISE